MPNKRSKRKKTHQFCCIFCGSRLWRQGSPKHFLFYKEALEIRRNLGISRKNSTLLAAQGVYVDRSSWLEEFVCGQHGSMWLLVRKQADEALIAVPATRKHWECTTGTIDPDNPNPSVSEFSYRMSRRADVPRKLRTE